MMKSRVTQGYSSRTSPTGRSRARAGLLALALGAAVAFGSHAALGRLDVGPDEQVVRTSNASLAEQAAQLDAMEANLEAVLAKAPPKLPPVPKYPPVKKPRVPKPQVITVSYAQDVTYEKDKKKYKKDKRKKRDEARKKREERRKHAAEKRREERKKREEERREERRP